MNVTAPSNEQRAYGTWWEALADDDRERECLQMVRLLGLQGADVRGCTCLHTLADRLAGAVDGRVYVAFDRALAHVYSTLQRREGPDYRGWTSVFAWLAQRRPAALAPDVCPLCDNKQAREAGGPLAVRIRALSPDRLALAHAFHTCVALWNRPVPSLGAVLTWCENDAPPEEWRATWGHARALAAGLVLDAADRAMMSQQREEIEEENA